MNNNHQQATVSTRLPNLHAELGLSRETLHEMLYDMVLTRTLDERMWVVNRQGKAPFVISGQGQEAAQVGSVFALRRGQDWFVPYYRDLAVTVAAGMTARDAMLHLFAKADDPSSGGRQMPGHYGNKRLRISGGSVVATQIVHATGIALASVLRGEDTVAIAYFGEGATSEGDFHEACNFAGVRKLPVIFMCENNRYAISVPMGLQMATASVAHRAAGYGMPGVSVDGNDMFEVYRATRDAADRARRGEGPTLIEARTYRMTAHSSDDDDRRYRSRDEVAEWKAKDPIARFAEYLKAHGLLTDDEDAALRGRAKEAVEDATEYADKAPYPRVEDMLKHVYASGEVY